jgi:nucleotide-binding universal stress UspA family protein
VTLQTVLVGTDGSRDAEAAVAFATGLARSAGARLVAVHAAGLLDAQRSPGEHQELRAALDGDWTRTARDVGVEVATILRDGPPLQVLLDVADEVDADILVVGSRGIGGFPQQLLGSTSAQLTQQSHRPVLVVPRPAP